MNAPANDGAARPMAHNAVATANASAARPQHTPSAKPVVSELSAWMPVAV